MSFLRHFLGVLLYFSIYNCKRGQKVLHKGKSGSSKGPLAA
uniref:Uncharacterized protein n=1 Tax=Rhizophora mucronata TaxID=61149 RepID=A0A2P2NXU7_RHIMU